MDNSDLGEDRLSVQEQGHNRLQNVEAHAMPEVDEDAEHPFQSARVRTQSEESGSHTPIEENSPFGSPFDEFSIHREECVPSNTPPPTEARRVQSRIRRADPIDTSGTYTYGPMEEQLSRAYPLEHYNIFQAENMLGHTPVCSGGDEDRDDEVNDCEDDEEEEQLQGFVLTYPVTTVADNATGGCQASAYVALPCPEMPCKKDMPPINVLPIPPLYPTFCHDRRQQQYSFDSWDEQNVSENSMLRTNFFFTGEGDKVTCSICGGTLQNWKPGDDPRQLHDRHFPRCGTKYYDEQYNQLLQFCILFLFQLLLRQNA